MFCNDCDELLRIVLEDRGLDPVSSYVHCGFDSGQGILKIAMTVTERSQDTQNRGRAKYSEVSHCFILSNVYNTCLKGVAAKVNKLSSVKKMFVLGAVPDIPENYPNVKAILDELSMEAVEFTMSLDIKMRK